MGIRNAQMQNYIPADAPFQFHSILYNCAGLPYLCDVRESNHIGDETDDCDEDLSSAAKSSGKLIHQSSDEAFHGAKLKDRIVETALGKCKLTSHLTQMHFDNETCIQPF